ncbi:MAG: chorismate synthase [Rikenellaceae bacterium]
MNSFGRNFKIALFGESHGIEIGVVVDGVPVGLSLSEDDFTADLDARRSGALGTTPRKESDTPRIVSGVFNGFTTGAPIAILFTNDNTRSTDYSNLVTHPRPGHADFVAQHKYKGFSDYRGGGHFSGRITLCLVAAGVIAKKILSKEGVSIAATLLDRDKIEAALKDAIANHDSLGGVVECRAKGIPIGWGEPFFNSVESVISHLVFSIPAIRGIEFGEGFAASASVGSHHNDNIINAKGTTETNNSGGINGGITNGNDIVFRVAVKPTSSISKPQMTYNIEHNKVEELVVNGRHDTCIALRVPIVVEAVTAIALLDLSLDM